MIQRSYQRIASFIALVAVLFAALAPTVSHALEAKNGQPNLWQEVCSAQGIKQIPLNGDSTNRPSKVSSPDKDQQFPNKMGMHFEHCPYCFSHAGSLALPPSSISLWLTQANAIALIDDYASPILVSYTSSTPPSRAPPHFN